MMMVSVGCYILSIISIIAGSRYREGLLIGGMFAMFSYVLWMVSVERFKSLFKGLVKLGIITPFQVYILLLAAIIALIGFKITE
jgi:hypothetical protein